MHYDKEICSYLYGSKIKFPPDRVSMSKKIIDLRYVKDDELEYYNSVGYG
jgi:hypothetical protein